MSFLKSLSPSHRAQRQEAQTLAEKLVLNQVIKQAQRGAKRSGARFDDETWTVAEAVYSNTKELGKGWTVSVYVELPTPFKFKQPMEGELVLALAQFKQKNARNKSLDRISAPVIRVDPKGMYFDIFLSYPD